MVLNRTKESVCLIVKVQTPFWPNPFLNNAKKQSACSAGLAWTWKGSISLRKMSKYLCPWVHPTNIAGEGYVTVLSLCVPLESNNEACVCHSLCCTLWWLTESSETSDNSMKWFNSPLPSVSIPSAKHRMREFGQRGWMRDISAAPNSSKSAGRNFLYISEHFWWSYATISTKWWSCMKKRLTFPDAAHFAATALAEFPDRLSSQQSMQYFLPVSLESSCSCKMSLSFTRVWWCAVTLVFSLFFCPLQPWAASIVWCQTHSSWRCWEVMSTWSDEPREGLMFITGGRWLASILPTKSHVDANPSESSFGYEWLQNTDEKWSK